MVMSGGDDMLIGRSAHNMDSKGRVILPLKFREHFGDFIMMTRGLDGCVALYGKEEWDKLVKKVGEQPMSAASKMERYFFSNAELAIPDAQGRIIIPLNLRKKAELVKEVVVIGVEKRAEIWDAAKLESYDDNINDEDILELLEMRDV